MPAAATDTSRSAAMSGRIVTIVRPSSMITNDSSQSSRGRGTTRCRGPQRRPQLGLAGGELVVVLHRQEARRGAVARHLHEARVEVAGQLAEQPLALDGGAAVDVLLHDEPRPLAVVLEQRPRVGVEGVGVEHARRGRIEAGRQAEVLEDHGAAVPAHRPAAAVAAGRPTTSHDSAALVRRGASPTTAASSVAPRLSRFASISVVPPPSTNRSSRPESRSASTRSPWPCAYSDGLPSSSRKRRPRASRAARRPAGTGRSRRRRHGRRAPRGSAPSVAVEVIISSGGRRPCAALDGVAARAGGCRGTSGRRPPRPAP